MAEPSTSCPRPGWVNGTAITPPLARTGGETNTGPPAISPMSLGRVQPGRPASATAAAWPTPNTPAPPHQTSHPAA
jgi:hypothetical protein